LLRLIAGLDEAQAGSIFLDGEEMKGQNPKIGMVFQEYSLFPWRTVIDNIAFGLEMKGINKEERYHIAGQYLDLVNLSQFRNSYPSELSGGMRQRVAVARALALDPVLLLMDEPFGALDAQTRNKLQMELLDIREETKKTIVFITHSVDEAVYLSDRIIVLTPRPGRISRIFEVTLPRPRERTSVEFAQVRREVLDLINQNSSIQ
ncbi:MAG: ABC transporter ATP-binding protein, partial [Methanoregula sp.]|nr:ABC transporter ATP-binding protein [Methanoregula sp.]